MCSCQQQMKTVNIDMGTKVSERKGESGKEELTSASDVLVIRTLGCGRRGREWNKQVFTILNPKNIY